MGFSNRWKNWISFILSTASTKIILNGSLGRRICHARGLRQGDPLSPLLFVLAMEALNALIKNAETKGTLTPFGSAAIQERIFLYADDVILFTSPQEQNLVATQVILDIFALASGLRTNTTGFPNFAECQLHSAKDRLHSANDTQQRIPRQCGLCRVSYHGHSAKDLPSALALGK